MKFKSLINIINKELQLAHDFDNESRYKNLKLFKKIINTGRTKDKIINMCKSYWRLDFDDCVLGVLERRLIELNDRLTHEYMMFVNFSDTKEVIKRLETEIEFYVDLKERLCK